jgi:hypothetical protein
LRFSVALSCSPGHVEQFVALYLGGERKAEPELDRLSNILKTFSDRFGNIQWSDGDQVRRLITEEIPARVSFRVETDAQIA